MTSSLPVLSTCRKYSRALALKLDFETRCSITGLLRDHGHLTMVIELRRSHLRSSSSHPFERNSLGWESTVEGVNPFGPHVERLRPDQGVCKRNPCRIPAEAECFEGTGFGQTGQAEIRALYQLDETVYHGGPRHGVDRGQDIRGLQEHHLADQQGLVAIDDLGSSFRHVRGIVDQIAHDKAGVEERRSAVFGHRSASSRAAVA